MSLSRALSRLQAERKEEAAGLAHMLAAKDKEVNNLRGRVSTLQNNVVTLHQQVATPLRAW